jgi:hypothetical protein
VYNKDSTIRLPLISQSLLVPRLQKAVLELLALSIQQTLFSTNKKLPITFMCLHFNFLHLCLVGRASKVGIASRFGNRIRIPVRARFSAIVHTCLRPCSLLYIVFRFSFPGLKRPGRGVDLPHPSSADVKKGVELYLYSPSFTAYSRANFTFYFYLTFTGLHFLMSTFYVSPTYC